MTQRPLADTEDAALVTAALAGSDISFAELVERYKGVVYAIGWTALRNTADAEDATAETFALAYRKLPGLQHRDRFAPASAACRDISPPAHPQPRRALRLHALAPANQGCQLVRG